MLTTLEDGSLFWDASSYPSAPSGVGRKVYYDTEGDNLLDDITKFHCIGAVDLATREQFYWGVDQDATSGRTLEDGLRFLGECDFVIAHNGLGFDRRALTKIYPQRPLPKKEWDSLILVKLIWPAEVLIGPDMERIKRGQMPAHMMKRHSLAAWGYRTGTHKGDYKLGFETWRPEMASYMMGDNAAGVAIWDLCMKRLGWVDPKPDTYVWPELPIEIEHAVHEIILQQEQDGVCFDMEAALRLAKDLRNEQARMETRLVDIFGSWWQPLDDPEVGTTPLADRQMALVGYDDVTIPRVSAKTGKALAPYVGPPKCDYTTTAPHVRVERVTFQPSSRDHLGQRLQAVYGWKPKAYGKNGKPTVDESVLTDIPERVMPEAVRQDIMDYFVVSKTLGTLTQGSKAWIKLAAQSPDGRIHGGMDTLGAVTRRGTHKNPNLSGTPSVQKEKVAAPDGTSTEVVLKGLRGRYGWECRELFTADPGWELTGIDCSSLEMIDLGHYLWPYDDGAFSARVCDPKRDPHQEHAAIAGMLRGDAKTTIYLLIYGGSAYKLSVDPKFKVAPEDIPEYLAYKGLPQLLTHLYKRMGEDFAPLDDIGMAKLAKARITIVKLSEGITGLKEFMRDVQETAKRGWLKALDGGKLYVRKAYAAPNTLLQGGGAVTCKLWMVLLHRKLRAAGLLPGLDFKQILWVHDELQFTHRPGLGPLIKQLAEEAVVEAGVTLKLRGRYRTDGKTGANWAQCH